jgi:hypothetical protein
VPRSAGSPGVEQEGLDLGIEVPAPLVKVVKPGVTWHTYKVKNPVHCDACVYDVHVHWPVGTHAPNRAVYRRKENGTDTYWCAVHAEQKRVEDGVSRAKPKKKARDV